MKNIFIFGLSKSGIAAALLSRNFGYTVFVYDSSSQSDETLSLLRENLIEWIENPSYDFLLSCDIVIKNPGIPYSHSICLQATELGIPIISEVEWAFKHHPSSFIGITGTNGKTTTTTLLEAMLLRSNVPHLTGGNIGRAVCDMVLETKHQSSNPLFLTELSSFQLQGTSSFSPKIGILLNLDVSHLDYHGSISAYHEAKWQMFANQSTDDLAILNADDPSILKKAKTLRAKTLFFSLHKVVPNGAYYLNGELLIENELLLPANEMKLIGEHNIQNALAASLCAYHLGVSYEHIRETLRSFSGVEHRLSFLGALSDVSYYNDSKSTNNTSTITALNSFSSPVILLVGGKDRGEMLDEFAHVMKHVKSIISFGEMQPKWHTFSETYSIAHFSAPTVREAVLCAKELALSGDTVLFSPGAASWGMYPNFEERGKDFMQAVFNV